tara:strand:- start:1551 stop:2210 length:660 start_codon:yes stop_codon:yes gene_type:complete
MSFVTGDSFTTEWDRYDSIVRQPNNNTHLKVDNAPPTKTHHGHTLQTGYNPQSNRTFTGHLTSRALSWMPQNMQNQTGAWMRSLPATRSITTKQIGVGLATAGLISVGGFLWYKSQVAPSEMETEFQGVQLLPGKIELSPDVQNYLKLVMQYQPATVAKLRRLVGVLIADPTQGKQDEDEDWWEQRFEGRSKWWHRRINRRVKEKLRRRSKMRYWRTYR